MLLSSTKKRLKALDPRPNNMINPSQARESAPIQGLRAQGLGAFMVILWFGVYDSRLIFRKLRD